MYFVVALILIIGGAPGPQETVTPVIPACKASTGFVQTPLMLAIWQGDFEMVKRLVTSTTDLNAVFPMKGHNIHSTLQTTPLIYAIHAKNAWPFCSHNDEIIEFLLAHNAHPNFKAPRSLTPLQMAATFADVSSIRMLLQHKVRLEERTEGGETALMMAAQREKGAAAIRELAAAGAHIHVVNNRGSNAVMLAAWQHNLDAVKLLVELGVDPCAKNHDGETAVDMAESNHAGNPDKYDIISFLKSKCR